MDDRKNEQARMAHECHSDEIRGQGAAGEMSTPNLSQSGPRSRREILKAGTSLGIGASMAQIAPRAALAQSGADPAAELRALQTRPRILLKGGVVLTLDRAVGDFARADVFIEQGKIREVRPNIEINGDSAAVVDAANRIIIPGFIDTHSHSYQGLLRNTLANGLLDPEYTRDIQNTLTPAYAPEDAYAGELLTALSMIDAGTTAMVDISQVNHSPEHSDACIHALQEAGIRAVYAYHRGQGPATKFPRDILRLQKKYFNSNDQLLTLALATSQDPKLYELAREAGVPAVLHASNQSEKILALARVGLLRPGDEYIHCLRLTDAAWRSIKESGGHVSLSPTIEMAMGHGHPAIQEALDHGFRPSLSTDHGATIAQDFFMLIRSVQTLQHLQILDRKRAGEQSLPPLLTARDLLEFATIEGARCANLESKVGTLTPGKDADLVVLAADRLNVWPINNAPGAVVNMNASNVESVFIAGKVKKWRGSLVGVDMARVLRTVEEARTAVLRRANFAVNFLT
jgi:cytosine/adenosine deaminase-related metal-dependent hydrolase